MGSLLKFSKVRHNHLQVLHGWIRAAGWKDDLNQVKAMFTYTPDRWVAAELDGQLVGLGALRIDSEAARGAYGYTMTAPEFQRRGIIASINEHVADTYSSVNPETKMVNLWKKYFPNMSTSFDIHTVTVRRKNENNFMELSSPSGYYVELYNKATHFEDLVAYDQKIHLTRRQTFLNVWLHAPTTRTCLVFDKSGHICGYGCLRQLTSDLSRIAPLFADNSDVARAIYETLIYTPRQGKEKQGAGHVEMALIDKERTWPLITDDFVVVKQALLHRIESRERVDYDLSNVYAMTDLCLSYV